MKKIAISTIIIIAFAFYTIYGKATNNPSTPASTGTPNSASANNSTQNNTSTSSNSSYKDGTYTGPATDAFYGNIQVQATISGGKITNIQFLQYPNDRGKSIEINQYADPQLAQEAIQAQNTRVDIVTGATDTSEAFIQSLTSALDQAKS